MGGIKVGSNLSITEEGVLSASGGSEPLILRGTISDNEFSPAAGFPTRQQIIDAYTAGTPILQKVTFDSDYIVFGPAIVYEDTSVEGWYVIFPFDETSVTYEL